MYWQRYDDYHDWPSSASENSIVNVVFGNYFYGLYDTIYTKKAENLPISRWRDFISNTLQSFSWNKNSHEIITKEYPKLASGNCGTESTRNRNSLVVFWALSKAKKTILDTSSYFHFWKRVTQQYSTVGYIYRVSQKKCPLSPL